jgi:hypothetical protein
MLTSPQRRLLREADADRRRLERQSVSGDEDAQSKKLVQQMRSGELTQDQVRLLSYLSYEPAKFLIPTKPSNDLIQFVNGLVTKECVNTEWAWEVFARVAIISARSVIGIWENWCLPNNDYYNAAKIAVEAASQLNHNISDNIRDMVEEAYNYASEESMMAPNSIYVHKAINAIGAVMFAIEAVDANATHIKTTIYHRPLALAAASTAAQSAKIAGSNNIRQLIEQELIKWTLNDRTT